MTLRLYYKLFPIDVQKDYEKLTAVLEQLQHIRQGIKKLGQSLKSGNNEIIEEYSEPLKILDKLIVRAYSKVQNLNK